MNFINMDYNQFRIFFLVLVRCSAILMILPVFGSRNLPSTIKITFSLVLAFTIFQAAKVSDWPLPVTITDYLMIGVVEVLIGLTLAMIFNLTMAGLQLAGQLVGFQMGTAMANVIDPQSGTQQSIVSQLAYLTAVLLFLSYNGHHVYIRAINDSISIIKPGMIDFSPGLFAIIVKLSSNLFVLSIKLMAPALFALMVIRAALGIIAKSVPQMNIMIVSFPLTIGVGLLLLGLSISYLGVFMRGFIERDFNSAVFEVVRQMGGSY